MKRFALLIPIALVAAACSAPAEDVSSSSSLADTPSTSSTLAARPLPADPGNDTSSTQAPEPATPPTSPPDGDPPPDGPLAPDFTMQMISGGSFTMSQAVKPVYMVFWAEW